jgi:hypothetical protein
LSTFCVHRNNRSPSFLLKLRQRRVRGVWPRGGGDVAPHAVELPHHFRIARPGMRRGDLFDAISTPQASRSAKRRDAALRADSGAGEEEYAVGGSD